jgi:hypothetical protein
MKRSEYHGKRVVHHEQAMGYYCRGGESFESAAARKRADLDVEAAEAAGVTWDPEEAEGFAEWYRKWYPTYEPDQDLEGDAMDRVFALACWSACLAHQGAGGGLSSKEIEAACANLGINLECGGCAALFYAGVNDCPHDRACTRQEAQGRTIPPEVDPEVRRKEIKAQIEAWAVDGWGLGPDTMASAGRSLLRRLGVL